ncbi:MAG: hypothetical protein ILP10_02105, partial [Lachnospiraceae bacterium]|nr:hypothetical protein [Lachnospiraceae bacterium]
MSERVKTILIAAVGFFAVAVVMCLIGGVLAKADREADKKGPDKVAEAQADTDDAQKEDLGPAQSTDDEDVSAPDESAGKEGGAAEAGESDIEGEDEEPEDLTPTPEGDSEGEGEDEPEAVPSNGVKIVIDAGHQKNADADKEPIGPGSDKTRAKVTWGTAGVATGIPEYVLTLAVAKKL